MRRAKFSVAALATAFLVSLVNPGAAWADATACYGAKVVVHGEAVVDESGCLTVPTDPILQRIDELV